MDTAGKGIVPGYEEPGHGSFPLIWSPSGEAGARRDRAFTAPNGSDVERPTTDIVFMGTNNERAGGHPTHERAGGHPPHTNELPPAPPTTWIRPRGGGGTTRTGRVASPNAKIAASYSGIGLSPDGGTTWLLPRLCGEQVARRFFFENQVWNAEEALAKGVIHEIVDEEILIEKAIEVANTWSQWGSHTKEATKHLLLVQNVNDFETHLKHERTLIEAAGTTEAFKEGVSAFLEKRKPNFD